MSMFNMEKRFRNKIIIIIIIISHWYDSTWKKAHGEKRDSNPGLHALEVDALPLATVVTARGQPSGPPPRWPSGPPRERKIPGSNPAGDGIFSESSHTID